MKSLFTHNTEDVLPPRCFAGMAFVVVPHEDCVPSFVYDGETVCGCTAKNCNEGAYWCSLSDPYNGKWKYCVAGGYIDTTRRGKWSICNSCFEYIIHTCDISRKFPICCFVKNAPKSNSFWVFFLFFQKIDQQMYQNPLSPPISDGLATQGPE